MVGSIFWTIDWNPEHERDAPMKRQIRASLEDEAVISAVKRFADQATREAEEHGLETEHMLWLDSGSTYAVFLRMWYEIAESKLFIVIEESDLGDVGFLILGDRECASYEVSDVLQVEVMEPGDVDHGIPR